MRNLLLTLLGLGATAAIWGTFAAGVPFLPAYLALLLGCMFGLAVWFVILIARLRHERLHRRA